MSASVREEVFRRVFERVVEACIASGLVGGEGFAVDAGLIQTDANKQRSIAGQDWRRDRDPARSSRAVKEYLATLDDTAWGAASDVVPKFVSPSDPAAQWTGAHKGPVFFAYSDNYLIDVKFGVSVDVEACTRARMPPFGHRHLPDMLATHVILCIRSSIDLRIFRSDTYELRKRYIESWPTAQTRPAFQRSAHEGPSTGRRL
jgi:hypothetical protein